MKGSALHGVEGHPRGNPCSCRVLGIGTQPQGEGEKGKLNDLGKFWHELSKWIVDECSKASDQSTGEAKPQEQEKHSQHRRKSRENAYGPGCPLLWRKAQKQSTKQETSSSAKSHQSEALSQKQKESKW